MQVAISIALSLACALAPCSATKKHRHRGASQDAPENTPAAFRLAWDKGFVHHVWSVNCVETADRFAKLGTTSIITDVPQTIREQLHP